MRTFTDQGVHQPFLKASYDTVFRSRGDYDPYVSLWMAILELAVSDMDSSYEIQRQQSRSWIFSVDKNVGAFRWICDHVGLEWMVLQGACLSRASRSEITKSQQKGKESQKLRGRRTGKSL